MTEFLDKFLAFAKAQNMRIADRRILVALSGGVDSVVLCDMLSKANARFGVAHCNFQLRGEESNADEIFCKALAEKYKVPFFSVRFDTEKYATANKLSIQEAARKLRYQWFLEIKEKEKFFYLATAHHANDNAETILYNIIKGTGIKGLRGIVPNKNCLIRPLLFAEKSEILQYQQANNLLFREDASNAVDKYSRNKIRLNIIPEIEAINPAFVATINKQSKFFVALEKQKRKRINCF